MQPKATAGKIRTGGWIFLLFISLISVSFQESPVSPIQKFDGFSEYTPSSKVSLPDNHSHDQKVCDMDHLVSVVEVELKNIEILMNSADWEKLAADCMENYKQHELKVQRIKEMTMRLESISKRIKNEIFR